ncbi:hypothetical protein [Microbacterium sp. B19]|uniref:hypothetical protein n=1 Tax=Microbacterium sp. B19 TaxID=96765 RepID=UPI0003B6E2EC|nr:hypothetical protein [Microbacterium sp. B19]
MIGDDKRIELLGQWIGDERLEATAWTPAGEAVGKFRIAFAAGVLLIDYEETRAGAVTVTGHGVATETGWWWFDSYGFEPQQPGAAHWEGATLHLDRRSPRGRTVMRLHCEGEQLVCEMATAVPVDAELAPMLSGRYTRTELRGASSQSTT